MLSCEAVLFCLWQLVNLIIFRLIRYTVLDPTDVPPVAFTTTETSVAIVTTMTTITSSTVITSITTGSAATAVSFASKTSNGVSIPTVVGITIAISVVAAVIIFLLCRRTPRAAQFVEGDEQAEARFRNHEAPPIVQPPGEIQEPGIIIPTFLGSCNAKEGRP
jgi:hypothetical protein